MLNHGFIKKANYNFENSLGPDQVQLGELNDLQSLTWTSKYYWVNCFVWVNKPPGLNQFLAEDKMFCSSTQYSALLEAQPSDPSISSWPLYQEPLYSPYF